MKCEKCGKEIPEGENKICDDCKKKLLDDLGEENKVEVSEKNDEKKSTKNKKDKTTKTTQSQKDDTKANEEKKDDIKKNEDKKVDEKEVKAEEKKSKSPLKKILLPIAIIVIVCLLLLVSLSIKGTDIVDIIPSSDISEGNSISNIRNYGYTAKKGSWIYYIAASEDSSKPAIYRSKKDGSKQELLYEHSGNVLGLNVYEDYIYFILIDDEKLESNTKLTDEESADLVNNKICRMKLNGENVEVINNNEFHNNCYEIYVVDDKVYYIGVDTNIYYMDLNGQNKTKLNNDETGYLGITEDYIILNVKKGMEVQQEENSEASTPVSTFETKIMNRDGSDLHALTGERLYSISLVGDYIYYVNEAKAIYKVKLDGSENTLVSDEYTAYNMNVTDKYIYYMNYTDGDTKEVIGIYRMDLDGKNNTLIYTLDNYSSFLNVVDNKVVFMDTNDEEATINLVNSDGEKRVKLYTLKYENEELNSTEENVETNLNVDTTSENNVEPVEEDSAEQE